MSETNQAPAGEMPATDPTQTQTPAPVTDTSPPSTDPTGKEAKNPKGKAPAPTNAGDAPAPEPEGEKVEGGEGEKAPETPPEVDYTFKPSEDLAAALGADDPVIAGIQDVCKEMGLDAPSFEMVQNVINALAPKLKEAGLLAEPYNFEAEIGAPGSEGETNFNNALAFIEAGKARGDFSEAEAAELAGLAATGAGLSALTKLRAAGPVDNVEVVDDQAELTPDQEASAIFKDPLWDKDRAWTAEKRNRLRELFPDQQI
jgi:hypothetical protein